MDTMTGSCLLKEGKNKMNKLLVPGLILLVIFAAIPVFADIYKYEDDEGVVHFTDAPTDKRFKIFMRDLKKDKQLRTNFRLTGCARNPEEFEPIINECALKYGVDKS